MKGRELITERRAVQHLMDCLKVEGWSGGEGKGSQLVRRKLLELGCKKSWITQDSVHRKLEDFEVGNLIVKLPGTTRAPRRLLMSHLDTVPLCRGAKPVRRGNRVVSSAKTAVGADNRSAVACIISVFEAILRYKLPHPPLTALFTVGEEVGLCGARHVKLGDLGRPKLGVNIDSGDPATLIVGATSADRWNVHVYGASSHAGMHPEDGISATLIASRAITDVAARGYFGKVRKRKKQGTSNVGVFEGGEATNQVTDYVFIKGESRSHDRKFVTEITSAYRKAFERAAKSVKNHKRKSGRVVFRSEEDYAAFHLATTSPVVRFTQDAVREIGLKPILRSVDGGLDANHLYAKGVPTVTIGAGQHGAHTTDEYVDLREYLGGCRLALELMTREAVTPKT
ncbi:MAG: M20/M25/M40 family metallo-hydrolase [Planctomycetes bacterium]|nr:M20/M25/M40 family metallo-hydrolase [Planctomycetota bacterium]